MRGGTANGRAFPFFRNPGFCSYSRINLRHFQSLAKIILPTFGQGGDLQCTLHYIGVACGISFRDVQASDFGDWDGTWIWGVCFEFIAHADFALASDCEIEARPCAGEEALHHVVHLEFYTQFVAGETRLGHDHLGRAYGEAVPDVNGMLDRADTFRIPVRTEING